MNDDLSKMYVLVDIDDGTRRYFSNLACALHSAMLSPERYIIIKDGRIIWEQGVDLS